MSLSTLTIRLPLVSGSKALPLWETAPLGLAGGLQSTHPLTCWRALTLTSREKGIENTFHHWQPASLRMGMAKVICTLHTTCYYVWFVIDFFAMSVQRAESLNWQEATSLVSVLSPSPGWWKPCHAHMCLRLASSEEPNLHMQLALTRSLWVTAIKRALWHSKMILHWPHVERAKIDGESTCESMVWRKTKNREARFKFSFHCLTLQRVRWWWDFSLHFPLLWGLQI